MSESKKLVWDQPEDKMYKVGVEQGAMYLQKPDGTYDSGVAWSGLTKVNLSPSGAEPTKLYANNKVYMVIMSKEELSMNISAYTYPDEFEVCQGKVDITPGFSAGQQQRKPFGFVHKSLIGSPDEGPSKGYELHLVYGALASPVEEEHATINETIEPPEMSWDCATTPVDVPGFVATSYLKFNSLNFDSTKLKELEAILYGSETEAPRLPLPTELIDKFGLKEIPQG